MVKIITPKIKIIIAIFAIIVSIFILNTTNKKEVSIASIKEENSKSSIVEIKSGSKIYETSNNISNETVQNAIMEETKEKNSSKVEIKTEDISAPDNLNSINPQVLENNVIVNFEKPKDNGSSYEYIVENNENQEKLDFYKESGLYGYSYKISNSEDDEAEEKVNKLDDSPFVLQNINFDDNYYLHIRTVDNNGNFSENKTFKIDIPSNGINIEYIDINTGSAISAPEKITGMVNDEFDANNLCKQIDGYTFVKSDGKLNGKLSKEAMTIKYMYAKNRFLTIHYVDKTTGNELMESKTTQSYEGEKIRLGKTEIDGYICENNMQTIVMDSDKEISLIYDKVEDTLKTYVEEANNQNINDNEKQEVNNQNMSNNEIKNVKYVDIDSDKILYEEKITTIKGKNTKYNLKEIEGYSLINDSENNEDSIIDEIIKSLGDKIEDDDYNSNDSLTTSEIKNIKSEY